MKKFLVSIISLLVLSVAIYKGYDLVLVHYISIGAIPDNGYDYNYLHDLLKVIL